MSGTTRAMTQCHPAKHECAKLLYECKSHSIYFNSIIRNENFSNRNLKLKEKCFTESVRVDSQVSDTGA